MKIQTKSRLTFIAIILIFLAPMGLAWLAYHFQINWGHTTNKGQLISPSHTLTALGVQQNSSSLLASTARWSLVYVVPTPCADACQHNFFLLKQLQKALYTDSERVQRIALFSADAITKDAPLALEKMYPDFLIAHYSASKQSVLSTDHLYLADPHGNVILSYRTNEIESALSDLKHLLRNSQIG